MSKARELAEKIYKMITGDKYNGFLIAKLTGDIESLLSEFAEEIKRETSLDVRDREAKYWEKKLYLEKAEARKEGAESMREMAAKVSESYLRLGITPQYRTIGENLAEQIRSLPLEDKSE